MIHFYLKSSSVFFPNNFFLLSSSSKQQETSNGEDTIQMLLPSSGQKERSNLQSFCILALVILENIIHNSDEYNQQYLSCVAPPPFISSALLSQSQFIDISPSPPTANQITLTLQKHDNTTAWPWHLFEEFAWLMPLFS